MNALHYISEVLLGWPDGEALLQPDEIKAAKDGTMSLEDAECIYKRAMVAHLGWVPGEGVDDQ